MLDLTNREWTDAKIQREVESAKRAAETARLHTLGPEGAAEELDRRCPHCHRLQVPNVVNFYLPWLGKERPTFIWPDACGCPEELEALDQERQQGEQRAERQARIDWDEVLDEAGLGLERTGWLRSCQFENFKGRPEWPGATDKKEAVYQYAHQMVAGSLGAKTFLLLYGHYGTGKSHLAASVVRFALDAGWRDCHYVEWSRWTEEVKESWHDDRQDTMSLHAKLRESRLLVLDDLDKKRPTGWTREVLYPILNHRYNTFGYTVLTFNLSPDAMAQVAPGRLAMEEYLGRAILDRLLERVFLAVNFDGRSYRSGAHVPADEKLPWEWTNYNGPNYA